MVVDVTVIDGATNNTTTVNVPVMAGLDPNFIAVNPTTNQIYVVAGSGSGKFLAGRGPTAGRC